MKEKKEKEFGRHPSPELNDLFEKKPYQGAHPDDATIIFVGRDPNLAKNIKDLPIFEKMLMYLEDGVPFWKKCGFHHPFLDNSYKGDGVKYHKNFAKMELSSEYADKISFVEFIGFPTYGMSSKNPKFNEFLFSDENSNHLEQLDKWLNSEDKLIFMANGLITICKQINKERPNLFKKFVDIERTDLEQFGNICVHTHFSDSITNNTLKEMSILVKAKNK